jgi:protein O-mannosyl-transferase
MSQKKLKRLKRLEKERIKVVNKEDVNRNNGIRDILKKNWKFLVILCVGIIALYFNSLWGDFVSDDYATIPQNPEIMSFSAATKGSFVAISNWLIAVTFGVSSPIAYHVTNLIFYLLILLIGFVCLKLLFDDGVIPYLAILIFSVFPIQVETVSWISGKPYLLNALFVLISMSLFILYSKTEKKKYLYYFIVSLFLVFMAEKVRSMALAILLILYWVSFDNKLKKKINVGKILVIFGSLLALIFLILYPKILDRINSVNSGINASDSIYYNPFFQYPTAMTKYLQLILVPIDLTLYHTMYVTPVWLNWLILSLYLIVTGWYFFKDKKIFFALAFIFGAAAPSMAPVKVSWLVAERYMFLGSLGMAMLIAILAEKFWNKKIWVVIVLSSLMAFYSVKVFLRNIDWQTNHNLWVSTCQVSPNSHNAWNNIGDDYDKLAQLENSPEGKTRQYENAIKGFGQSYAIKPNYADAYHNQANIFYKIGRLDLARNAYETALSFNANMPQTLKTLIQLDLMEKNITALDNHLAKLQQLAPNDLEVAYVTAVSYIQTGRSDQAKELVNMMYQQFPNVTEIKNLYNLVNIGESGNSN